jgi:alpha-L-arabinofuranosidase
MTSLALLALLAVGGQGTIEVDASRFEAEVPRSLYGVFLEEINNSGEGGLYAEMIQNRGFEDANAPPGCTIVGGELHAPKNPSFWEMRSKDFRMPWPYRGTTPAWTLQGDGATMAATRDKPLTKASPTALRLEVKTPGARVENEGFWGINVEKGKRYDLSLFVQSESYIGPLEARLVSSNGAVLARHRFDQIPAGGWKKLKATLVGTGNDPKAKFALVPLGNGRMLIDFVSLFPRDTFMNRPNGLRSDLAKMIRDLRPGFIRWPGGCVVEGITIETRPRWDETLGPIEDRVPTFIPWGYWVSNGFGYHEWLQFCEDVNAEPLYVFNAGISCAFRSGTFLPDEELPALIQNTLDAIEYAIGPPTSKWGALRAKNGHPKPFKMRVVEIGNEQQGPRYGARVKLFAEAIKKKYPQLKVALSSWISGIDQPAIDAAGPLLDIVDEHAYRPVNWAVQNFDSFARYPRNVDWKLYIGEFATNSGVGRGNMLAAIGDAAYMMSMEKNADLVTMGSYAPLLENTNRRQWEVNLIHFDSSRAYGRASYHACKMFAENRPDVNLATRVAYMPVGESPILGPIGLGTYGTEAEFKEVKVEQNGLVSDISDFSKWRPRTGNWTISDGVYRQSDLAHDRWTYFGDGYRDATVTLKARKIRGAEGFVVSVGNADGRRVHFNVGGWNNVLHGLEAAGPLKQVRGSVEIGRWYDVKVQTIGSRVLCYLDGKLVFDETLKRVDTVLAISGLEKKSGDVIVKLLNTGAEEANMEVSLKGARVRSGTAIRLASADPHAENSYSEPRKIIPVSEPLKVSGTSFRHRLAPYSLNLLRLKTR